MKRIYLAIPYTGMTESSYRQANKATLKILNKGMNVFSPISHCHSLTTAENEEDRLPETWEFWEKIDYQFIHWADEIYVLIPEEGIEKVRQSTGVQAEIAYATKMNKEITYVLMEDL